MLEPRTYTQFFSPSETEGFTRANLPHWNQSGKIYFVTFRLADSMPQSVLDEWRNAREDWIKFHPFPWDEKTTNEYYDAFDPKLDAWLDSGHGSCLLKEVKLRDKVAETLLHFDGNRYEMISFVIMPNHVHAIFRLFPEVELKSVLKTWKGFSAREINKSLSRQGTVWQKETFDRIVRSEKDLEQKIKYIMDNPKGQKIPVYVKR